MLNLKEFLTENKLLLFKVIAICTLCSLVIKGVFPGTLGFCLCCFSGYIVGSLMSDLYCATEDIEMLKRQIILSDQAIRSNYQHSLLAMKIQADQIRQLQTQLNQLMSPTSASAH